MIANGAIMFQLKVLYPYHFGDTDTSILEILLNDTSIDVRIRAMR